MARRTRIEVASNIGDFTRLSLKKGGRFVPARLQSALALLEKLRDSPSLDLADHLAARGSSGLKSHETFGNRAHDRLNLEPINSNHGRRSSHLQEWGQSLLDILKHAGFADATEDERSAMIHQMQIQLAAHLRAILEQEPLLVRVRGHTAEHIIHDVLEQAEAKGKSGDVAQYLVGAKLALRFNRDIPVYPANKADRRSRTDRQARAGDFQIANAVIEVAVGIPDEKHLTQLAEVLENRDVEVWLLTQADRVDHWRDEIRRADGIDTPRVVVSSVDAFVGQNISELGEFSTDGKAARFQELFDLYNTRWIELVGTPGIRIEIK